MSVLGSGCSHYRCSRNCGEMCDRPRCNKKCPKVLGCGHPCIGVCGEPCLEICLQCLSVDDFQAQLPIFFGYEHDDDVQFIVLEDCRHALEVTGLDHWMDQVNENEEIKWKCCPQCNTPVMRTFRYSNIVKQTLQDMNEIKEQKQRFLSIDERKEMRDKLLTLSESLHELESKGFINIPLKKLDHWYKLVPEFGDFALHKAYLHLLTACDMLKVRKELRHHTYTVNQLTRSCELPLFQVNDFLDWIRNQKHADMLTDQMTIDIKAERRRILLLEAIG